MAKSDRFFEIIQILRRAKRPMLARELAETLEVSRRTIYRDIATLQAMQTPILGEPGVGYVMRRGYDLPAVNFDIDEAEAVAVGLTLIARTGDVGLWRAARRAARKLGDVAPGTRRLVASSRGIEDRPEIDLAALRAAIRSERKLRIDYAAADGTRTRRVIWPLVLIYYVDTAMLAAWCELRRDLRHFRTDRIRICRVLEDGFAGQGDALISRWEAEQKRDAVSTRDL